jgi:hypothetical protein
MVNFSLEQDYDYRWKPQDYLYYDNFVEGINKLCLPFYEISSRTILGAIWMKGHDVIFDRENSKIGFAESDCSYEYGEDEEDTNSTTEDLDN